jgi:predicted ATP-grasp superfamily ATP-dependent carboligase
MKRVLLTCGRIPSALFLARALHKAGAEVHVADPFAVHLCKQSNSVHTNHRTSSPMKNNAAYKMEILDIINKYKIDIVIPVFEDGVFLAEFYNDIASQCNIVLSDFNLLLQLHDKFEFIKLASSHGLATPTTYKYDFPAEDFEFIKNNKFITKKIFSRSGSGCITFEAGEKISAKIQPNGEYVIQEFIPGQLVCTCSYVHNGKLILHTAYKQLIVTPNGTAAVCFQATENATIQESIESFVSKINYNGWISFDIILQDNGDFYYIECNPRTSLGICLYNPNILAQTLLELTPNIKIQDAVTTGNKAQIFLVSLECVLRRFFKRATRPNEFKNLLNSKDIIFDRSDLLPYLYQVVCYVYMKYIALKLKTNFLYAGTHDLEWN